MNNVLTILPAELDPEVVASSVYFAGLPIKGSRVSFQLLAGPIGVHPNIMLIKYYWPKLTSYFLKLNLN